MSDRAKEEGTTVMDVRVQVTVEVDDVSMYFERRFEKVPTARVRSVMGGALSAMTGDALEHLPEGCGA